MEKEEISFVKQMINSMDETLNKMKWSYQENNEQEFNKYKKIFIHINEELKNKINGI